LCVDRGLSTQKQQETYRRHGITHLASNGSLAYVQLLPAGFSGGVLATLSMIRGSPLLWRLDQDITRGFASGLEVQAVDGQLDVFLRLAIEHEEGRTGRVQDIL
jgi:hypothetical protein